MRSSSKYIFLKYFKLGDLAYRDKVRFYEENPEALSLLGFDDRIEIEIDYMFCLFEIGKYDRYLSKVDALLEAVISENIYVYKNENVFNELLFRKAACLYQFKQFDKSKFILGQLIKMDKQNALFMGLYVLCQRKIQNDTQVFIKAASYGSLLIVVAISFVEIILHPFLQSSLSPFLWMRNGLFCMAFLLLITNEFFFQYQIYKDTKLFSYRLMNKIFG